MELRDRRLSHYRILDKLGEGGMGTVYRAEDVRLGRQVALKLLPQTQVLEPKVRSRFLAEARAIAALEHPHVCLLYEFDEVDGQPFLAMQLVEGETLREALARGPLGEDRTREVIRAVGEALVAAHTRGVLHRDVKSDNILLGRDGSIKLADFGVALLVHAQGLTSTSSTEVGTPAYLAPELVEGHRATEASDQFSLAVVAYESVTGGLPFTGGTMAAMLYAIVNSDPEPPSRLDPRLSPQWDRVLARALAKDRTHRYPTVRDFVAALVETGPTDTQIPSGPAGRDRAYALCSQAQQLYARYTHADNLRALECYERAVAIDSGMARGWAGIADCCGQMHDKGWDGNPAWLERGITAARRAVELEPRSAPALKSMALIQIQRGEHEAALESLHQAIAADSRYVPAYVNRAAVMRGAGDLAGSERDLRNALRLDPKEPYVPWALAYLLLFTRRYGETIECCDRFQALGASPYFQLRARVWRACAYAYLGDRAGAEAEIHAGTRAGPHDFGMAAAEALLGAMRGDAVQVHERVRELEVEVVDNLPMSWILAEAAGTLGDVRTAVRILKATERSVTMDFVIFRVLPGLSRVRDRAEFQDWIGDRGRRLVWPAEAPPLSAGDRAQFLDYRETSGQPDTS